MSQVPVDLDLSQKSERGYAQCHRPNPRRSLLHRLSTWRELHIARKALRLAGEPGLVLDLPCGLGDFWPMLAEKSNRQIVGADLSVERVTAACQQQAKIVARVKPLTTSAFAIELPDGSVDSVFSMRLLHHMSEANDRQRVLKEFHRVTRDTVILSLWVDGNYSAWRTGRHRGRGDFSVENSGSHKHFLLPAKIAEAEFRAAGFTIEGHLNLLAMYAMRRIYILRKG